MLNLTISKTLKSYMYKKLSKNVDVGRNICRRISENHICHLVNCLKFKCLSYFSLPFVHKGGPLGPNHFKVLFGRNFSTKLAPYLYTPKTTINQQKNIKKCCVSKWRPKTFFFFCENSHVTKIWKKKKKKKKKKPFPNGIFQWNLAQSKRT